MKKFLFVPTAFSLLTALSCGGGSQPTPASGTVSVAVSNSGNQPVFFAYQDGSGNWQTSPPTTNGYVQTYQFNVNDPSGKYGVVVFCGSNLKGWLYHALTSERNSINVDCGTPQQTLSGQITWGNNQLLNYETFIYWGKNWQATYSGNYSLNTPEGTHDVIGLFDQDNNSSNSVIDNIQHVVIYRNVNVSSPTVQNVSFTNAPQADNSSYNWNCGSGTHQVHFKSAGNTTLYNIGDTTYKPIIPSSLLQTGDFWIFAFSSSSGNSNRAYFEYHAQANNYTCASVPNYLNQGMSFSDVDVGQASQRISMSWQSYSSGITGHTTHAYKLNEYMSGATYYWYMYWTTGWLGGSTNYTFPNLSALTGWNNTWYPAESTQTDRGNLVAYTSNKSIQTLLQQYMTGIGVDGMELVIVNIPN